MRSTEDILRLGKTKLGETDEMGNKYRKVFFGSHEGTEVLDDILRLCHYYDTLPTDNPAVIAMHNIAKVIMDKAGLIKGNITVETLRTMFNLSSVETIK